MAIITDRTRYRTKLTAMLAKPPTFGGDVSSSLEGQAQWAKYACVLVSGFIEQSIKEILLAHVSLKSTPNVARYIETTWPASRNMNIGAITEILEKFDPAWAKSFSTWVAASDERKATINSIIAWRNNIAHGNEANTTGVTMNSVKNGFKCACSLVDSVEDIVTPLGT